jgi:decaprenylphospho-beta-D-ribofuranose 2-oxidase
MELFGWGRFPRHQSDVIEPVTPSEVERIHRDFAGLVARGNGRAYGDAAVGQRLTLHARRLDRMIAFDAQSGRLTVEAGVLLADILQAFVPRGFFPPVVPGTKLVTIGGMIAADVHGKNHHRDGGFGDHVEAIKLTLPTGKTIVCSPTENAHLFAATIGGMGLTGTIVEATFRLRPVETGWMRNRTIVATDLDSTMKALRQAENATYSVAWIDCLARGGSTGRSLIYVAEHASLEDIAQAPTDLEPFPPAQPPRLAIPVDLPAMTLNHLSVTAFNELYFRQGARKSSEAALVHWNPYFFPLDGVVAWNRIYGRRGFVQHQCVIPAASAAAVLGEILEQITNAGSASFLTVLKQLGPSHGKMSFPMDGYTLAVDFPLREGLLERLAEIDRLVSRAGGRVYLAKDARQSRETFEAGYPGLREFREIRHSIGADGRIISRLSERLGI